MPTTSKLKSKPRKTREAEIVSDLEKMNMMLGINHFEWKDKEI